MAALWFAREAIESTTGFAPTISPIHTCRKVGRRR